MSISKIKMKGKNYEKNSIRITQRSERVEKLWLLSIILLFCYTALKNITGWDLDFLVGWFMITGWFGTIDIWNASVEHKSVQIMTLGNYLLCFVLTLGIVIVGKAFFMAQGWYTHSFVLGIIASVFYNLCQIELIKKQSVKE